MKRCIFYHALRGRCPEEGAGPGSAAWYCPTHAKMSHEGAEEEMREEQAECLLGSSTLPSTFKLRSDYRGTGRIVQLGEIVREGFRRSGLTVAAWNALVTRNPEVTDALLQVVVDDWGLV